MTPEDKLIVDSIARAGFEVYMRLPGLGSYAFFTDGKRIGYIEWPRGVLKLSTVHRSNPRTGTGFAVDATLLDDPLSKEMLERAFIHAPAWVGGDDRKTVHKFKSWDEFVLSDKFNSRLVKVA